MPATIDRFTRRDVLRIVGITPSQLGYWERLRLIQPSKISHNKIYTFGDIVSLRAVKHLKEQRVPVGLVRQAVDALRKQLTQVETPLTELRISSNGSKLAVEYQGVTIEPITGQLLINFETSLAPLAREGRGAADKISAMRRRSVEEWFALAQEYEKSAELRSRAIEAYQQVLEQAPESLEAHVNLGTLLYEQGNVAGAREHYRLAVQLAPANPLAQFNLGTVLDDLGEFESAAIHLREAVRLKPGYADAHYNLACVCEKLKAFAEARSHWRCYLELDAASPWAQYARERLTVVTSFPDKRLR